MKSSGGEIIEVQGGHIVRSTSRKDRHSKVYTSKGPRDRRVRLSADTAIQFYDVQDRLGYDRPSKAVDWLIEKAKNAIDKLDELPPWHPSNGTNAAPVNGNPADISMADSSGYRTLFHRQVGQTGTPSSVASPFGPSALDPMRSFFPKCSSDTNPINLQGYQPEMISRATNQTEDLCLSLNPFQDPQAEAHQNASNDQTVFHGSAPVGFEGSSSGWPLGRFQRMLAWNNGSDMDNRELNLNNSLLWPQQPPQPPQPPQQPPLMAHSPLFSQHREHLQTSTFSLPSSRAWDELTLPISSSSGSQQVAAHESPISEDYQGFRMPAQIRGQVEHVVLHDNPSSSASPYSGC